MTKLRSSVFWNSADVIVRQIGQFVIAIVLARLVSPAEFGLIALLTLFAAIATVFVDTGLSAALVQRSDITRADESTVFWFNIGAATVVALLLGASARWIVAFYGEPRLYALTWVMALNVWLSAWQTVPNALIMKRMEFQTQIKASIAGILAGGSVAIWLGLKGNGVWALAAQMLVTTATTSVVTWFVFSWRPVFVFRWESFVKLATFGVYMLLSGLLDNAATRLYTVLIGKLYSPVDLGFFARAAQTKDAPQTAMGSILSRLAFPLFSKYAHDTVALRDYMRRVLVWIMALNAPVMLGIAVTAHDAVLVLFGARWLPAAPFLQVLALVGLLYPIHVVNLNVLMAKGYSHLFFRLEVIKKILMISIVLAACPFGVMAIAWGMAISSTLALLINCWYTKKMLNFGVLAQFRAIAPYLAVAAGMDAAVLGVAALLAGVPAPVRLLAEIVVGVVVYAGLLVALRVEIVEPVRNAIVHQIGRWRAGNETGS